MLIHEYTPVRDPTVFFILGPRELREGPSTLHCLFYVNLPKFLPKLPEARLAALCQYELSNRKRGI